MSNKAVDDKSMIKRDGQTQQQRKPQWLDPGLVPVDARTQADFLRYLQAIAKELNFYEADKPNPSLSSSGTWESFFDFGMDDLTTLAAKASLPPHIALWNTFMQLYEHPKALMNTLTKRHLDFYYGEVLRLKQLSAVPDQAHVVFELKKNSPPVLLEAGTSLLAGKDATKKELHYQLTHDLVLNNSKVVSLKSLYVNALNHNLVHHAPVANSSDGLGAELDKMNPTWSAFGHTQLPLAPLGFCLASNILRMQEGEREVVVKLTVNNLPETAKNDALTADLFMVSITGEKGWIGPKTGAVNITSSDNKVFTVSITFTVTQEEPAVIAYDPSSHGGAFDTVEPILQILVNQEKGDFGYKDLLNAVLVNATLEVNVTGIKDLQLENDFGTLNAKKPFLPFGPAPDTNANFSIGSEEVFSKRLKEFSVDVEWTNIPSANLGTYFSGYGTGSGNSAFTALTSFQDGYHWQESSKNIDIFKANDARVATTWTFTNANVPAKKQVLNVAAITEQSYSKQSSILQKNITNQMAYKVPAMSMLKDRVSVDISYQPIVQGMLNAYKEIRTGRLSLRLRKGFFFKEYPRKYTEEILRYSRSGGTLDLPVEPFAPEIQSVTLNYKASTVVTSFGGTTLGDYLEEEILFFHQGAFGQMREHAYARSHHRFLSNDLVKLVPEYNQEGEFFIGLTGLSAGDSVCMLFQVAEGSADPDKPKADLAWSVLCDNYWKELTPEDFIFDTTNDLLTSGVIKLVIPSEATTVNTIMPAGLLWVKAALSKDIDAVCNLVDVQSNAAIAVFDDQSNDPLHLALPLPAGMIKKLAVDVGAVKSVKQPYASFGGKMQENEDNYYTRVSERLRHKERGITLWDIERIILQHFPRIHKVKCINHASDKSWYAPGHVRIIVVPDLSNQHAVNPFQPRVDKNTLDEVAQRLQVCASPWATFHVSNPMYEPVKIAVNLTLRHGFEFNYYEKVIDQKLQELLSPWITNTSSEIHFGGKITKSMIIKFLEELEFVDFITSLSLFHLPIGRKGFGSDQEVVEVSNPAAILVSHDHHEITNR